MTWHSTVDYYRLINEGVQKRLGGSPSAEKVMLSVDFGPVEEMQTRGEWGAMGRLMAGAARTLSRQERRHEERRPGQKPLFQGSAQALEPGHEGVGPARERSCGLSPRDMT